jgi:hypothetical protein
MHLCTGFHEIFRFDMTGLSFAHPTAQRAPSSGDQFRRVSQAQRDPVDNRHLLNRYERLKTASINLNHEDNLRLFTLWQEEVGLDRRRNRQGRWKRLRCCRLDIQQHESNHISRSNRPANRLSRQMLSLGTCEINLSLRAAATPSSSS